MRCFLTLPGYEKMFITRENPEDLTVTYNPTRDVICFMDTSAPGQEREQERQIRLITIDFGLTVVNMLSTACEIFSSRQEALKADLACAAREFSTYPDHRLVISQSHLSSKAGRLIDVFSLPAMHDLIPALIIQNGQTVLNLDPDRSAAVAKGFKTEGIKFTEREGLISLPIPPRPVEVKWESLREKYVFE